MSLHIKDVVKIINSDWDIGEVGMSADGSGGHYKTYYIKSGGGRCPTFAECLAIADYMGMKYHKGYFYRRILWKIISILFSSLSKIREFD